MVGGLLRGLDASRRRFEVFCHFRDGSELVRSFQDVLEALQEKRKMSRCLSHFKRERLLTLGPWCRADLPPANQRVVGVPGASKRVTSLCFSDAPCDGFDPSRKRQPGLLALLISGK
jgi:hypothetical protein